jgi:hypothetical protein
VILNGGLLYLFYPQCLIVSSARKTALASHRSSSCIIRAAPLQRNAQRAALCSRGLKRAGLFPRRFLFGAFRFQPERAAAESGRVEIALRADALEVEHGTQAVRGGL